MKLLFPPHFKDQQFAEIIADYWDLLSLMMGCFTLSDVASCQIVTTPQMLKFLIENKKKQIRRPVGDCELL